MAVSLEQRHVPLHIHAEAFILVAANRKIRAEEDGQVDVRLLRDAAQQRSLILDRMAHQIGQSYSLLQAFANVRRG
ncbi:hypothetical protein RBB78_14980 [Tunturiibacter empetritectus]|uniref:hypothetical protein n=1 Tax=Tunturiibacter empetritectus TaxID=3069691 RepID=UPI003D9BA210